MDDPIEVLFSSLPSPREMDSACPEDAVNLQRVSDALSKFVADSASQKSCDPDAMNLLRYARLVTSGKKDAASFIRHLSRFALFKKTFTGSDTKQRQLEYYRWVGRGRKSVESPFKGESEPAVLPESNKSLTEYVAPTCNYCNKKGVDFYCQGCYMAFAEGAFHATYYCNEECQVQDLPRHLWVCQDWNKVRRAALLFQGLINSYIIRANDRWLLGSRDIDGVTVANFDTQDAMNFMGGHLVHDFDWPVAEDGDRAIEALMNGQGETVLKRTRCVFDLVFRVIFPCDVIEAVTFYPKNLERPVLSDTPSGITKRAMKSLNSLNLHTAFRITMASGLKVMYDPTCRQFGWMDYLTPLGLYQAVRMHHVQNVVRLSPVPIDPAARQMFGDPECPNPPTWAPAHSVGYLQDALAGRLYESISKSLVHRDDMALITSHFMNANYKYYHVICRRIVDTASQCLDEANKEQTALPSFKAYYDPAGRRGVTRSVGEYNLMVPIWFTEEEYNEIVHDRPRIVDEWLNRFKRSLDETRHEDEQKKREREEARRCAENRVRSAREEQLSQDNKHLKELDKEMGTLGDELGDMESEIEANTRTMEKNEKQMQLLREKIEQVKHERAMAQNMVKALEFHIARLNGGRV
ncbi:uncharacterized protein E0L32_005397 [Thyridium curvatum]|uniref:MYND-type domain-containing protein n=1 Tax=Thyridium curvatum TaxID=1093900 RepID=A0A507B3K6_9PEZI|nr:uncharacterized protein E0L32_005397 [Thyridium curvatum]TPX14433.1 hypothetical protein E0L32_005397 [Thyridium curvatum]